MGTKHFKIMFSIILFLIFFTSFTPLLSTVPKLYYTYYLRLLMMVLISKKYSPCIFCMVKMAIIIT